MIVFLFQANRHVGDLFEDLRDGHNLISLLEVLSGEHLVSSVLLIADFLIVETFANLHVGITWSRAILEKVIVEDTRCLALMMEGTALFRNVGNFTNRHGVTSRKA
jgi:hypothetical protein